MSYDLVVKNIKLTTIPSPKRYWFTAKLIRGTGSQLNSSKVLVHS